MDIIKHNISANIYNFLVEHIYKQYNNNYNISVNCYDFMSYKIVVQVNCQIFGALLYYLGLRLWLFYSYNSTHMSTRKKVVYHNLIYYNVQNGLRTKDKLII